MDTLAVDVDTDAEEDAAKDVDADMADTTDGKILHVTIVD